MGRFSSFVVVCLFLNPEQASKSRIKWKNKQLAELACRALCLFVFCCCWFVLIPKYRSTASKGFRTTCFNSNGFSDASGKRAVPVKQRERIRG